MQEQNRLQWLNMVHEAQRLQRELDASLQNVAGLETKLYHARRLLEAETKCRKEVEKKCEQAVRFFFLLSICGFFFSFVCFVGFENASSTRFTVYRKY